MMLTRSHSVMQLSMALLVSSNHLGGELMFYEGQHLMLFNYQHNMNAVKGDALKKCERNGDGIITVENPDIPGCTDDGKSDNPIIAYPAEIEFRCNSNTENKDPCEEAPDIKKDDQGSFKTPKYKVGCCKPSFRRFLSKLAM